jgi:biotin carboxyl carrier protein
VEVGQPVEAGQPLVMLEAMKMENEIRAPFSGTVCAIHVTQGQSVVRAEVLAEVS